MGKLLSAEAQLAAAIARLHTDDSAALAELKAGLSDLGMLQRSVASAHVRELGSLQITVAGSITGVLTSAQASKGAANVAAQLAATTVALGSEIKSISEDLFERRIFDRYLRFGDAQVEEAYRQREAANQRYIEEQLARRSPEGQLNASGAAMDQMLDAHEHGAGASPEFHDRWNRLSGSAYRHRKAMQAAGHSTEEFDQRMDMAIKRYLSSKGLSDKEIEARLADAPDPLDAVKPYLKSERDMTELERTSASAVQVTRQASASITRIVVADETLRSAPTEAPSLQDVMAKLRDAGLSAAVSSDDRPSHGLNGVGGKSAERVIAASPS